MDLNKLAIATGGFVVESASKSKSHLMYITEMSDYGDLTLEDIAKVFRSSSAYIVVNTSKRKAYYPWKKDVITETDYVALEKYARRALANYTGSPESRKKVAKFLFGRENEKIDGVPLEIFANVNANFKELFTDGANDKQIIAMDHTFSGRGVGARYVRDIKYGNPFDVLPEILAKA